MADENIQADISERYAESQQLQRPEPLYQDKRIAELEALLKEAEHQATTALDRQAELEAERDSYKKTLRDAYNSTASWGCGSCIRIRETIREALNQADTDA